MRSRLILAIVVFLSAATMAAQTNVINLEPSRPQAAASATMASPGFSLPGGIQPPAGLFDQFWNDPACASQLHLTDDQRKQLQAASLTQRLSLIDGGADAMKAFVKLSAILEAEPLDDAAYQKQLDEFAAASGKLVQSLGTMAVTPRRVLSTEQWNKLRSLQRAKQAASRTSASTSRRIPSSLSQPIQR